MTSLFENLNTQKWILLLTVLLLVVTLILLFVTIWMRRKPKPLITVDEEDGVLKYKNIGDDSAIDIQTEEVNLNLFSIFFPKINLLEPTHKKNLEPKVTGRTSQAEHYVGACEEFEVELFPYFKVPGIYWYTLVTHYENLKGKKFISVVLVRCTTKNVEHKLCGREWWINLLDKLGLIRKLPKPPKDVHFYTSD